MLVNHGRAICRARGPKCPECPLRTLCPSAKAFIAAARKKEQAA
jgi:endonuclease-3